MTKPHIVELILDLCGYDSGRRLHEQTLLDFGCGDGEFLVGAANRLLQAIPRDTDPRILANCLLGVEKDKRLASRARERLRDAVRSAGISTDMAGRLARSWVLTGDFLTMNFERTFDFVVGNPPYVRQEAIPKTDLVFYRETFRCFYDRADLYVAFLEKGLSLLGENGILAVICPNRFTRNRYGSKLRALITENFRVLHAIDLAQGSPFNPEVMAYPGIYVVGRGKTKEVNFFHMSGGSSEECKEVLTALSALGEARSNGVRSHKYEQWFSGEEPWITESPAHLDLARRLESRFHTLGSKHTGTHVGIGVATGADRVFIVPHDFAEVEKELLLPLAMTSDCVTGKLRWGGLCVINPFKADDSAELIDLSQYPWADRYFRQHENHLRKRNVGKRNASRWYRTIDRIYPHLLHTPKLLIPDIKAEGVIAFDSGTCYPHHNLYYITADYWNLEALRTILRSSIARFFVWVYGVRMRSDFLRFQAQYLRRIPIPSPLAVSKQSVKRLASLADETALDRIDEVVAGVFGLSDADVRLIHRAIFRSSPSDSQESPHSRGFDQSGEKNFD